MVLHEFGHLIVASLFGAEIKALSINLLNARVSYNNGGFTSLQNSLVHVAGVLLPLIISFIAFIWYKRESLFSVLFTLLYTSSIASLIPFVIPMDNTDTINLIMHSNLRQGSVSLLFGIIFLFALLFLLTKKGRNKLMAFSAFVKNKGYRDKYTRLKEEALALALFVAFILFIGNI